MFSQHQVLPTPYKQKYMLLGLVKYPFCRSFEIFNSSWGENNRKSVSANCHSDISLPCLIGQSYKWLLCVFGFCFNTDIIFFKAAIPNLVEAETGYEWQQTSKFPDRAQSPEGALGYFLGGYVPLGTPNWHPVLKKIFPKIDSPF